jgi:hypothetical protein
LVSLVEGINEVFQEKLSSEGVAAVHAGDIHVLQQRTLYQLPWSNLWGVPGNHAEDVINVDVSVGLVICTPTGARKHVVQYQAHRFPDRDWGIARMGADWLDEPPKKPWTSEPALSRGLGIAWGVVAHSPNVGKGRITLANGYIAESPVSNGSFLIFVPFHTAELWASTVKFGFYDTQGREIVTENYPLPVPPPVLST